MEVTKYHKEWFEAESVNKDWEELYFKEGSTCGGYSSTPIKVGGIRKIEGRWVHSTKDLVIAWECRYGGCDGEFGIKEHWEGYEPKKSWEELVKEAFGERAVPIVRQKLDEHPYKIVEDYDEEDE